ncbi:carboxymuconolactone decarboxylase family protein [Nitratifractor salsuginis]|uniref:Alkylhydroperoxidase like protein, AhpD family n=1 Tax=Nitratifractor salsuginis (strain DSM 16511 / JCM 12458 / E9I37-1) TaxID=749222 RepID=E6X115_NITSE|nr:carboxymuconolactone decarboxylase family protein [Nitratifractor salsuginis]ADV45818.1 alkylhydroperoxidase like protein, AhpD family [Nitratifractor salsuginis DSM 16511]
MQMPTPEQVEQMMMDAFGELPSSIEAAKAADPSFLVEQAMSARLGTKSEKNVLDPKTTTMIFLAAALATGSEDCIEVNTSALLKMGASKEEILSVVRIVRHAAFSKVVGDAKTVFDLLK